MSSLRVLIVDSDALAVARLARLLRALPGVEVVGAAADSGAALEKSAALQPDLVIVDTGALERDRMTVVRALRKSNRPIIFVTAFADQAVEAFDSGGLDCLLKPVEPGRLRLAIDRARTSASATRMLERVAELEGLLAQLRSSPVQPSARRPNLVIWAMHKGESVGIGVDEIDLVRAEGDYVRISAKGTTYLLRQSLDRFAERLPRGQFLRVHRSALIRVDRVRKLRREGARLIIYLAGGEEVPVSRRRAAHVTGLAGMPKRRPSAGFTHDS